MNNYTPQSNSKQFNGTEFTFNVYPYLPGTFLIGVYYNGSELAATVVSQQVWLDKYQRKEIMTEIGVYLRDKYIKPKKQTL